MSKGKVIVIDGLDGCGKTTQHKRIINALSGKANIRGISFPDYDMPSAALVKMYLAGEFSKDPSKVNAYAASTFYAADRYASYKLCWEKDYLAGVNIIASRYVCSNAIHQMPKLPPHQWNGFLDWLCDYEYDKLGLPRPDKTILLDISPRLSAKRLTTRYGGDESKKDIHETDNDYLSRCRECALYAAARQRWVTVPCEDKNGTARSEEDITGELINIINEVIGSDA